MYYIAAVSCYHRVMLLFNLDISNKQIFCVCYLKYLLYKVQLGSKHTSEIDLFLISFFNFEHNVTFIYVNIHRDSQYTLIVSRLIIKNVTIMFLLSKTFFLSEIKVYL